MAGIEDEIAHSNHLVLTLVWPHVSALLGGDLTVATGLWDTDAGIDFVWKRGPRVDTLAARVQSGGVAWDTFTIRSLTASGNRETEWLKRRTAWMVDGLRPGYTLQAYVSADETRLLSAALVISDELYRKAFDTPFTRPERRNIDGSRFRAIYWSELDGTRLWLWPQVVAA